MTISFEYQGTKYDNYDISLPSSREYLEESTGIKLFEPLLDENNNKIYDKIEVPEIITKTVPIQEEVLNEEAGEIELVTIGEREEYEYTTKTIKTERVEFINPNPQEPELKMEQILALQVAEQYEQNLKLQADNHIIMNALAEIYERMVE